MESRVKIPVRGMYWAGIRDKEAVEGDMIEETEDGKEQAKCSPPNSAVTGTVVFKDRKLDPETEFTANGKSFRPADGSNHYATFEPSDRVGRGKIYFAKGDETEYECTPSIHFEPSETLNKQQALLLMNLTNTGYGKVQGRNDDGHLVAETVDVTVVEKEGAK
jgi:hypothetical protein